MVASPQPLASIFEFWVKGSISNLPPFVVASGQTPRKPANMNEQPCCRTFYSRTYTVEQNPRPIPQLPSPFKPPSGRYSAHQFPQNPTLPTRSSKLLAPPCTQTCLSFCNLCGTLACSNSEGTEELATGLRGSRACYKTEGTRSLLQH